MCELALHILPVPASVFQALWVEARDLFNCAKNNLRIITKVIELPELWLASCLQCTDPSVATGQNAGWDPHSAEVVEKGKICTCNRRELNPMHQPVAKSLD